MNINESLREWINSNIDAGDTLADLSIVTMGEDEDLSPPFLAIYESNVGRTNDLVPGVSTFEITCELQTVPASGDHGGTSPETEREYRRLLYDIIGDERAKEWMTGRNCWQVFDIRLASPITESADGRRISKWSLQIVACPI